MISSQATQFRLVVVGVSGEAIREYSVFAGNSAIAKVKSARLLDDGEFGVLRAITELENVER